jgi:hypothetical protein
MDLVAVLVQLAGTVLGVVAALRTLVDVDGAAVILAEDSWRSSF